MTQSDDTRRKIEALRERIAAILRINESLDLDTVLVEAMDCARRLTEARYGVIVTVDERQVPQDLTFSGLTPEQEREVLATPDGPRLFELLRNLPAPSRLPDFPGYVRELGLDAPWIFSRTFLGTPLRHRDEEVGHFFLGDKAEGEEFTGEDEEVLALFASQTASAIANARTHRAEQRARADLEALVETSPVGVVVFDAKSGHPVSFNREARRIVEKLRNPGHPLEQILEVLSCQRADGREVSLSEFPIAQQLGASETVRAEEMVLSVPDGRSVRTLINATPIHAADGAVESVVVTMQDLAPLDEIERLRTEFLGLVSHELRTPLAAIKGSVATVLDASQSVDPAELREFLRVIDEQANQMRGLIGDLLDAGRIEAGTLSVAPEPLELAELVEQARATFLGGGGRHGIVVDLPVGLPRAMADRRRVVQVLNNLFSNAARHAPESSPIRVAAAREGGHVAVSIRDEGRGVAPELLPQLFNKHTGAGDGGAPAGHGLGLAICKGLVEAHGGRIRADSAGTGRGTTVTFTIPVAGESGGEAAGCPPPAARETGERQRILVVDDDPLTLRSVGDTLSGAGYAPLVTGEPQELAHMIRTEKPRLVLLDLILPGGDGIELMGTIPELSDLPVIFISAYGRDETVAKALEAGAADYIVKPFSPTELVARVRAALRRHEEPEPFVLGALAIDYGRRRVTVAADAVDLTPTEFELLRVLSLNAGRVVTYDTLLRRVWSGRGSADANLVRIFVRNLRRKLGDDAANPTWIFNERGVGYRMPEPGER
ncbi:MAG: response regulator [Deltaproteobacteria bacterium]|nr:response regulator [Deltaproteobacteria bacterium]